MENTREAFDSMYMNIENFSKAIAKNWKVDTDNLKDYIFANISVGLVKNNEMKKDINKIFEQNRLVYYNAACNSSSIQMKKEAAHSDLINRSLTG